MIVYYNLIIIFIFIIYLINSYYLSLKQNIIKLSSFLIRVIFAWVLANMFARTVLNFQISNSSYEYVINGEVINNIIDIIKVLIIKNFPDFAYIVNKRSVSIYIIESFGIMIVRTLILIISFIVITTIYRIFMLVIKKINKNKTKTKNKISKAKGLVFGLIQGLLVTFIISIPFSGLSSLTNSILKLDNNITYSKEITFLKDYKKSITGRMFSVLNINKKPLDIYVFDEMFAIEIDSNTIYLCEEVSLYVDVVNIIEKKNIDITSLENNIDEEFVFYLIDKLKSLKSLNISVPLLIDYFLINYYNISLEDGFYDVNYYNECKIIGELLILYINNYDNLKLEDKLNSDKYLISKTLFSLSKFELLDKLSLDITRFIMSDENVKKFLSIERLDQINLNNVNYQKELKLLSQIFDCIFEVNEEFRKEQVIELSLLISSSDLLMDNDQIIFDWIINKYLSKYSTEISRLRINEQDIRSLIVISKALVDNGFLEPYFRTSKLFDEDTIDLLIDAITSSDLLINNLNVIIKLFIIERGLDIDFEIIIPSDIDFKSDDGILQLRELLNLFMYINSGSSEEVFSSNIDNIAYVIENSLIIKANIINFLDWIERKYNISNYKLYIMDIDFLSPEGDKEIESLINILKLLTNKNIFSKNIFEILNFSREEIDIVLSSKIIEEALIHFIIDLSYGDDIPIVVNLKEDDKLWYKSDYGDGELRNFIYAIKIIFKNVKSYDDIKFSPELILSIDDGTIDTNGDGIVDEKDENELKEIMKSKVLSDSIIKFIYDYYKDIEKRS